MRICVVGHFVRHPDEGVGNICLNIADELSKRHDVLKLSIGDVAGWRRAKRFKPEILHFVLSPSNLGLVVAKLLASYCSEAKTVMSAPHPDNIRWGRVAGLFRPDLTLVQSAESERMFQGVGYKTLFFPNGVDCDKFRPVSPRHKRRLRQDYGIPTDRFVALHVGPLTNARDVRSLGRLQRHENQVLIVGRPSERGSAYLRRALERLGCIVWLKHLPDVDEVFGLSDCYVFPVPPQNRGASIEMPLSVMEAMSCNIPVVTTRFGALPRALEDGDGLVFVEDDDEILHAVARLRHSDVEVATRRTALQYCWSKIVPRLDVAYEQLLSQTTL